MADADGTPTPRGRGAALLAALQKKKLQVDSAEPPKPKVGYFNIQFYTIFLDCVEHCLLQHLSLKFVMI